MTLANRGVLDKELNSLRERILQLSSMVDSALEKAMSALANHDLRMANDVSEDDEKINQLRYSVEQESLRVLATQQPAAGDLRKVLTGIHIAVELERMGDHAAGIARLVERLSEETPEILSLHKIPKMADRARKMVGEGIQAFVDGDAEMARTIIERDEKLDRHYAKLFIQSVKEMHDDDYIRSATYLLWIGHNLERIGDRATNIAERVIFMVTGEFTEVHTT